MKKNILSVLLIAIIATFLFSCGEEDNGYEKLRNLELEKLETYIQENYPNAEPTASGLYYFEIEEGVGDTIRYGDRVQIFYSTMTIDSILIDESSGYSIGHRINPYEFIVGSGSSITGLEEAAIYMKPGTKANLVINSELAYGQNGTTGVSGFTTLLMEVEVYKVFSGL